jgi:hypothetical protein
VEGVSAEDPPEVKLLPEQPAANDKAAAAHNTRRESICNMGVPPKETELKDQTFVAIAKLPCRPLAAYS